MGRQSSWWPRPAPLAAVRLPHAADLTAARPPPQSMFAVGWMELKEPGRAWGLLERSFANITEPFKASLPPAPASPPAHQPSLTPLGCGVGSPALGHSRVTAWQFPRDLGPPGSRGSGFGRVCVWGPRTDCLAPPQVWTENSDGSGAVNFLTGMGGFLQAALFGFTGFR